MKTYNKDKEYGKSEKKRKGENIYNESHFLFKGILISFSTCFF